MNSIYILVWSIQFSLSYEPLWQKQIIIYMPGTEIRLNWNQKSEERDGKSNSEGCYLPLKIIVYWAQIPHLQSLWIFNIWQKKGWSAFFGSVSFLTFRVTITNYEYNVSTFKIPNALKSPKATKLPGPDSIQARTLKEVVLDMFYPLYSSFYMTFGEGEYQSSVK